MFHRSKFPPTLFWRGLTLVYWFEVTEKSVWVCFPPMMIDSARPISSLDFLHHCTSYHLQATAQGFVDGMNKLNVFLKETVFFRKSSALMERAPAETTQGQDLLQNERTGVESGGCHRSSGNIKRTCLRDRRLSHWQIFMPDHGLVISLTVHCGSNLWTQISVVLVFSDVGHESRESSARKSPRAAHNRQEDMKRALSLIADSKGDEDWVTVRSSSRLSNSLQRWK